MNLELLQQLENAPTWKKLKNSLLSEHLIGHQKHFERLSYYGLIHLCVDEQGMPIMDTMHEWDTPACLAFTDLALLARISRAYTLPEIQQPSSYNPLPRYRLQTMMLGELVHKLQEREAQDGASATPIKINPVLTRMGRYNDLEVNMYLCEEVLFAPLLDASTQKLMTSDPAQARALMALNTEDQARFGVELVFHMVTNYDLVVADNDRDQRQQLLKSKLDELSFLAPRIPMKRGSGNFYCVIVNLENALEEAAFIRQYRSLESYTDVIFVTSELEIKTGELESIPYDGNQIDTIFSPLIQWQQTKRSSHATQAFH